MADKASAAVAVPKQELELAYAAIMDGEELPVDAADPEVVSRIILQRIAESDSLSAILTPQSLPGWRDYEDRPVEVQGFRFNRSSFEGGSSIYAVVDLTLLDSGEQEAVSVGGRNVLVQLVRALQLGEVPFKCKLTSKKTGEGYNVLWLTAV